MFENDNQQIIIYASNIWPVIFRSVHNVFFFAAAASLRLLRETMRGRKRCYVAGHGRSDSKKAPHAFAGSAGRLMQEKAGAPV